MSLESIPLAAESLPSHKRASTHLGHWCDWHLSNNTSGSALEYLAMSFQLQNSEVLARLKPFGILFEKSLTDLIKGIRSHSKESPESLLQFFDTAIVECKNELATSDLETKAMAVLKLTYLEMYGFDMSWSNFQILEVMASSKFQQKRIGYLAVIQSFKNDQDLLILATNQFKKDLNSYNHTEIGLALSGIATIVTPNLAKDINDDVVMKLSHSSPYIRKKAMLAMYKVILQYPESLRVNFQRIIDKLDDDDTAVVSATINVICEISKKNPNIFVGYLPKFFAIMNNTSNNWLVIRILKLFQSLSKVEPRMKKRIMPSIVELMTKTSAYSLIYECINCIVSGDMLSADSSKDQETAKLCLDTLLLMFTKSDYNLVFVGLLTMYKILKKFPALIDDGAVRSFVLSHLGGNDIIIKEKALELCDLLVNEDNIGEIVKKLLFQLMPPESFDGKPSPKLIPERLRVSIASKIVSIASSNNYSNIPNFKWYVAVLKDIFNLSLFPESLAADNLISFDSTKTIANLIGNEYVSLCIKVPSLRPTILNLVIIDAAQDVRILEVCPVFLKYIYWIIGEYVDEIEYVGYDEEDDTKVESLALKLSSQVSIFNTLVNCQIDVSLKRTSKKHFPISDKLRFLADSEVLTLLIQALVKLYSGIFNTYLTLYGVNGKLPRDKYVQMAYFLSKLINFLSNFEQHSHYEVQERSLSWLEFLKLCLEAMMGGDLVPIRELELEDLEYYKKLQISEEIEQELDLENSSDSDSDEDLISNMSLNKSVQSEEPEVSVLATDDLETFELAAEGRALALLNDLQSESGAKPEAINEMESIPMLLHPILSSMLKSHEIRPVAKNSQSNIPFPEDLDLEREIVHSEGLQGFEDEAEDELYDDSYIEERLSSEHNSLLPDSDVEREEARRKKERAARLQDDPYYLKPDDKKNKVKRKSKPLSPSPEKDETRSPSLLSLAEMGEMKRPKSLKSKVLKKEKVMVLDDEVVGNSTPVPEEPVVKKPQKRTTNVFKIDASNLEGFDLESSAKESTPGVDEYNIDLEALRKLLAEDVEKKLKKKSKKSKSKSDTKTDAEKSTKSTKTDLKSDTRSESKEDIKSESREELVGNGEPGTEIKTKKKKKKRAVIAD